MGEYSKSKLFVWAEIWIKIIYKDIFIDGQGKLAHLAPFNKIACLLRGKRGGLSLTSVRVTVTDVVPESPPFWPTISFAWITSKYWSLASLSMFGRAVLMTPVKFQIPVKGITIHWIHTSEEHWHRSQGPLEMLPFVVLFIFNNFNAY